MSTPPPPPPSNTSEHPADNPGQKKLVLLSAAIGATAALLVALIAGAVLWFASDSDDGSAGPTSPASSDTDDQKADVDLDGRPDVEAIMDVFASSMNEIDEETGEVIPYEMSAAELEDYTCVAEFMFDSDVSDETLRVWVEAAYDRADLTQEQFDEAYSAFQAGEDACGVEATP
ncbi:MAG: hypothetical protein QM621_11175 [Aeromicrobium sp.]|uniref:hypothetical protein n=1 Tax=Aeromicrobium sp. TaxID=1871063 RepID=UPI0039E2A640